MTPAGDATSAAVPAPQPPSARPALDDTPLHRHLQWLLDVVGRRRGIVDTAEIDEHWDAGSAHGPVTIKLLLDELRGWGTTSSSAYVDDIEVDDPTFLRAHCIVGDRRWLVTLSLEPSSMKIDFLQKKPATRPSR